MNLKLVVPVLAALAFAAPALAQDAGPGPDMAKHHAEMCTNHYARAVGGLATLEVKLQLTNLQKPLFERWKAVKLANAKAHSEKCGTMMMPGRDMSIMDGVKLRTAMLEQHLADLKAETPALEALVKSLNDEQQKTFKRAGLHAMEGRMHGMEGFMGRHHGRMMHGDGNPPPPPPAN